jgi:hypothetical protein
MLIAPPFKAGYNMSLSPCPLSLERGLRGVGNMLPGINAGATNILPLRGNYR